MTIVVQSLAREGLHKHPKLEVLNIYAFVFVIISNLKLFIIIITSPIVHVHDSMC